MTEHPLFQHSKHLKILRSDLLSCTWTAPTGWRLGGRNWVSLLDWLHILGSLLMQAEGSKSTPIIGNGSKLNRTKHPHYYRPNSRLTWWTRLACENSRLTSGGFQTPLGGFESRPMWGGCFRRLEHVKSKTLSSQHLTRMRACVDFANILWWIFLNFSFEHFDTFFLFYCETFLFRP